MKGRQNAQPVTIIGGGVAGLTAAIALADRGVDVEVVEAVPYPRHRVCGEFLSGRGVNVLAQLGLLESLENEGGLWLRRLLLFAPAELLVEFSLAEPALSVPRFVLDHFLARNLTARGGRIRHERWRGSLSEEGVVRATGRRLGGATDAPRWIGIKAHARRVRLDGDIEVHLRPGAYVGLSYHRNGALNVCGLFQASNGPSDLRHRWRDWLSGPVGSILSDRLAEAEFDPQSLCFVSGFQPNAKPERSSDECRIGDSWSMIPPFAANGLSMALESGELAAAPLSEYARGERSWIEAKREVEQSCRVRFGRRLRLANLLHPLLLRPRAFALAGAILPCRSWICRRAFGAIR